MEAFDNQSRNNVHQMNSEFFDHAGLSLGHKKEAAVVDTIKEVITNATDRMEDMLANKREGGQFNRAIEQQSHRATELSGSTSAEEDDGEEVQNHRGSMYTFTPSKSKQWSPGKRSVLELVAKEKTDGKDEKKKEEREKKKMKDQERVLLKTGFIENMRSLEESQAALNSQLQQ